MTINFEEFQKVDLRVVRILEAERVEGSEKLLKLKVDCGMKDSLAPDTAPEKDVRQIIAGIGKAYAPEQLIGKEIAVVANLEPRMLMGLESQGMVLAATKDGLPVILHPATEVDAGAALH